MLRFIAVLLLLSGPAAADNFPALYDVVDVASDDTLNIRSDPSSKAGVIGTLEHDAAYVQIEALDPTGRWAQVSAGEAGMGWVFARYLQPIPGGTFPEWPELQCSGSEAPWSVGYSARDGVLYRFGYNGESRHLVGAPMMTPAENTLANVFMASDGKLHISASLKKAQCWSTMIETFTGIEALIFVTGEQQHAYYGCCKMVSPDP